jgi:glycosyltransferase involved in cell wall biosynthesis
MYSKVDCVVCLNSTQENTLNDYGFAKTCLIPHGVDERLFCSRRKRGVTNGPYRIGILSKRYPNLVKGEKYLAELLHYLPHDAFRFVLVGAGRARDDALFQRCNVECEIYEYLPYKLFPALYDSLDFLGVFSVLEGGPANLPEAVASGVPILARPVGAVPDVLQDGYNGLLLPDSPLKAAALLQDLCANVNGICGTLFENAFQQPDPISWREVVNRYAAVYRTLASGRASHIDGLFVGA